MIEKPLSHSAAVMLFAQLAMYHHGVDVVPRAAVETHLGEDAVAYARQQPRRDFDFAVIRKDGQVMTHVEYLTREGYYKAVEYANITLANASEIAADADDDADDERSAEE